MKAVVYGGPGQRSWTDVSEPKIVDPRDAVIQVDAVTICGTDLHILKGDVPAVQPGRILGHEAVGTVVDIGGGVTGLVEGDRVVASCISACGICAYCRHRAVASSIAMARRSPSTATITGFCLCPRKRATSRRRSPRSAST